METPLKYGPDDRPGLVPFLLYGLQWWVVSLPMTVILGLIAARLHHNGVDAQIFYLQKVFGLVGLTTIVQIYWGHRLPLVVGPAAVLLVGITASASSGAGAVYTGLAAGGLSLALAARSGLLSRLRTLFTSRIVAIILILIAFTLTPSILRLTTGRGEGMAGLGFAAVTVFALILCNARLPGVFKSLTVLFGLLGGVAAHYVLFGPAAPLAGGPAEEAAFFSTFAFEPGVLISFVFCYLALSVNELGSVESIGHMVRADDMEKRVAKGAELQGWGGMASGALGVLGSVDYSLSAGVIAATGCASRHTLLPAGAGLLVCAFFPDAIALFCRIPDAVMGALMLYLLSAQLVGGLHMLVADKGVSDFNSGIIVALPLMVGLLFSLAPTELLAAVPGPLRPLAGNGFIMGTVTALVLEHLVFGKR